MDLEFLDELEKELGHQPFPHLRALLSEPRPRRRRNWRFWYEWALWLAMLLCLIGFVWSVVV